jgi:hypothetical protein
VITPRTPEKMVRRVYFEKTEASFYIDDNMLILTFPHRGEMVMMKLTWFDPTNYTDEQLIHRIKNLLVFL